MNKTRKSLLTSALSLLLCCAMLVGTTFAWFTDSVTSSKNIIQAGTLDVVLEYYDGTEWKDVKDSSEIFDAEALWEPGYVQTAYLRMKNNGTLAFNYDLSMNIVSQTAGTNVAGESFLLSDHIYFDVFEGVNGETAPYASREAALANTTETNKISGGYAESAVLEADTDYKYYGLVVYMPTTTGNEANYRGTTVPTIDFGIKVVAKQATVESDSFDNQYDVDAEYPITTANDLINAINEGKNAVLAADITLTDSISISNETTINLAGYDLVTDYQGSGNYGRISVETGAVLNLVNSGSEESNIKLGKTGIQVIGGTLNINEGITIETSADHTASYVSAMSNGVINMYGGTITGVNCSRGCTVQVIKGATFNMYDGYIEGSTGGWDPFLPACAVNSIGANVNLYGGEIYVYNGTTGVISTQATETTNLYIADGFVFELEGTSAVEYKLAKGTVTDER